MVFLPKSTPISGGVKSLVDKGYRPGRGKKLHDDGWGDSWALKKLPEGA